MFRVVGQDVDLVGRVGDAVVAPLVVEDEQVSRNNEELVSVSENFVSISLSKELNKVVTFYLGKPFQPGACIIKLITAVIYGFRNKLECLSLASLPSLVYCLRTNPLVVNYGRNKFYDTGPMS